MNKAVEYLHKEHLEYKLQQKRLEDKIHSNDVEMKTIEKRIRDIEKNLDRTGEVFHSVNFSNAEDVNLSTLNESKMILIEDNELIKTQLNDLNKKIEELSLILKDENDELNNNQDEDNNFEDNIKETDYKDTLNILQLIEEERQRISRDIHDTVVQNLTALIHKQEFISQIISKDPNRASLEIKDSKKCLKESVNELRNIIFELRPMALDDLGFNAAFLNLCSKIGENYNYVLETSFNCNVEVNSVVAITVLRIISELASNSSKHSECSKVKISVRNDDDNVVIDYYDDGCGFDFDCVTYNPDTNSGYGIKMLKERVELLRGTITYSNEEGSHFIILLPMI
ncbi:MAG: histidine kinase [Eubacteriales bacterium]|nr:histidine kinase [Eubacteriales bacterium]